jgi:broad specificity phosphatase PhoE
MAEPDAHAARGTTVFLVRHGQTALNARGRFRGRRDPPLDERGRLEAEDVARRLGDDLEAVFTSPLLRAAQTAEHIARAARVGVITLPQLVDADYGSWEGMTQDEARAADPDAYDRFVHRPREAAMPGGESMAAVERRILDALAWAADTHPGGSVAAVSHEIPIRLVIARLAGTEGSAFWDVSLPTGAVVRLYWERGTFHLLDEVPLRAIP